MAMVKAILEDSRITIIKKRVKSGITILLLLLFLLTTIQFSLESANIRIAENSCASSHWLETNWSTETNYSTCFGIKTIKSTGDIQLHSGKGFIVADYYNARIVQTNIHGTYWRPYGSAGSGKGQFRYPFSLCYDNNTGFVYVTDAYNYRIVKTKIDGTGWTTYGTWGVGKGNFYQPTSIDYDPTTGYIYVADSNNHRIVRTKINGSGWKTLGSYGSGNSQFSYPCGLDYDETTGYIYVSDTRNNRIIRTDINGNGWVTYGVQGTSKGQFYYPGQLSYDSDSDFLYVLDRMNHRIVKTKINGSGWTSYGKFGTSGSAGEFYYPIGIDYNNDTDFVYVSDYMNSRIVRTKMNGSGWKTYGKAGTGSGTGTFYYPLDVAVSKSNFVLNGHLISKSIDLGAPAALLDITYKATIPTNTTLKFQFRTGPNETALEAKPFVGTNGSSNKYYSNTGSRLWSGHTGDRWVQYKVYLNTNDPEFSPRLKDLDIHYNLLPKRPVLLTPSEDGWINSSQPLFDWTFLDSDSDNQSGFQLQIDDNKKFLNIDFDSKKVVSKKSYYFSVNSLTDGVWYWRVRTKDTDGGWGDFCNPGKFQVDTKPPSSTVIKPQNNSYHKKLKTFSGTAIDPELSSGINKVELKLRRVSDKRYWTGSTWDHPEVWLPANGTYNWNYDASNIIWDSGETYVIRTRAWDNVSNVELFNKLNVFHYDNERPVSKVIVPADNSSYNKLLMLSGSANDIGGAGVKSVEIKLERVKDNRYWSGKYWEPDPSWLPTSGATEWLYDSSEVLWDSGTEYIITPRATDTIAQIEIHYNQNRFTFDLNRPRSSIIHPVDGSFVNDLEKITGKALDTGGAGVATVEIKITRKSDNLCWDGDDWIYQDVWLSMELWGDNDWHYDPSKISWSTGKYYKIISRATDLAKNYLISKPGNTFMFDDFKPEQDFKINDGAGYTNLTNVTLTLNYQDIGSGVSKMAFSEDGELWTPWEDIGDIKIFELTSMDSEKAVYFKVKDLAGNIGDTAVKYIILDTTPPQCSMTFEDRMVYTNSKIVKLNILAQDTFSGVTDMSFSTGGTHWSLWEPFNPVKNYEFKCNDGRWKLHIRVRDIAGNIGTTSNIIILDRSPPESVSITINNGADITNEALVTLNLTASDSLSGLCSMSLRTLEGNWSDWEPFSNKRPYELPSGNGQKILYLRVRDKAGNAAIPASSVILLNEPLPKEYTEERIPDSFMYNIFLFILVIIIFSFLFSLLYFRKRRKRINKQKEEKISIFSIKTPKKTVPSTMLNSIADQTLTLESNLNVTGTQYQLPQAKLFNDRTSTTLAQPPEAIVIEHVKLPIPNSTQIPKLPPAITTIAANDNCNRDSNGKNSNEKKAKTIKIPGQVPIVPIAQKIAPTETENKAKQSKQKVSPLAKPVGLKD